jgi:G3E family GTPase
MLQTVTQLAHRDVFDHMIIESSGASEPLPVAAAFAVADAAGCQLAHLATLDTMVCPLCYVL